MKIKAEYEENKEALNFATQLIEKHPDVFGGIDIENITFRSITNQERPEKKKYWETKAVPNPVRLDCPQGYYITVWKQDWEGMDEEHQILLVCEALQSVPTDPELVGKVIKEDVKEYGTMIRTFGLDYWELPKVPNLLKDTIKWVVR